MMVHKGPCPFSGRKIGPRFRACRSFLVARKPAPEAVAAWQWSNFWEARIDATKRVVHINMDETSVKLFSGDAKGAVAALPGEKMKETLGRAEQRASLRVRRSAISHVAFVCDDEEIQRLLPQVIIGNEKVLPRYVVDAVSGASRLDNIFILRRKSSWVNASVLVNIVNLLAASLKDKMSSHAFILSMDGAPAHTAAGVPRACARGGMMLVYIPACMTSMMQPCDTHVFARYKSFLRKRLEQHRLASVAGCNTTQQVVETMCEGIREVLEGRSWVRAFQHTGLREQQRHVGRSFLRKLQWAEPPSVSSELPSLRQLQAVYRAGATIPLTALFQLCLAPSLSPVPPSQSLSPGSVEGLGAWRGRLRSSSSLALAEPDPHRMRSARDDPAAPPPPLPPPACPPPLQPPPASLAPRAQRLMPPRRDRRPEAATGSGGP